MVWPLNWLEELLDLDDMDGDDTISSFEARRAVSFSPSGIADSR
jgi:hypothetical protein